MDERKMNQRLLRNTIFVLVISIIIIITGGYVTNALRLIQEDTQNTQMQDEVEQYKIHLNQEVDAHLQTLQTLSAFFRFSDWDRKEEFAQGLYESNTYNDFVRMAYFDKSGTGIRVVTEQPIEYDIAVDSLSAITENAVYKVWQGESFVSDVYYDEEINGNNIFYGVPVYDDGEVKGALLASCMVDDFASVLDDRAALNGEGAIHLIQDDGTFLVRSKNRVIAEDMTTIFDNAYISNKEEEQIKTAMQNEESCFSFLNYSSREYQLYFEPVGINGWYLYSINTAQGIDTVMYQSVVVTRVTFGLVMVVILVFIILAYRRLYMNHRELIRVAYQDALTGASNSKRFQQKLDVSLRQVNGCSIAALNVHQFKFINEIFGKDRADELLIYIKKVLESNMGEEEYFCRDSSDVFFIFLAETEHPKITQKLTNIINEIMRHSFYQNNNYQIMLYCGVAVCEAGAQANEVITHALFSLKKARENYRQNIVFFDAELHQKEKLKNHIETHMQEALKAHEFKLFLQPKVDLRTGHLGGAEALVRWIPEKGKMFFPDQFIPLFEINGFCMELDMYMFELACKQIREWIQNDIDPIPISVNQSKLLFYKNDYVESLDELMIRYGVPKHLITLEILENLAMKNLEQLNGTIDALHEKGFKISMDDFGSGYSSLNILAHLKIDELKLDKAFLMEAQGENDQRQKIIMGQIIKLTKQLKIATVVEGVETARDERFVKSIGCDLGQGYYYSKPISAEDFSAKYMQEDSLQELHC